MKVVVGVVVGALVAVALPSAAKKKVAEKPIAVSGYGVTFTPRLPFEMGRGPGKAPDTLLVAHAGAELKNAIITPGPTANRGPLKKERLGKPEDNAWIYRQGADGTAIALGAGMKDLAEIGKAVPGRIDRGWSIEAAGYRIAWPEGFKLLSTEPGSEWPFELEGARGVMIVLRGPLKGLKAVPPPAKLVAPGQKVVGEGTVGLTWIEVEYDQSGQTWRQKHYYGRVGKDTIVLVTGQGPASQAAAITRACETILESLSAR
jgi:hypothetical protein